MNSENADFTRRIMRRIYFVYVLRLLTSPFALGVYLGVVAVTDMFFSVSLAHVYANMPSISEPLHIYHFIYTAVAATEWMVKLACVALVVSLAIVSFQPVRRLLRASMGVFALQRATAKMS